MNLWITIGLAVLSAITAFATWSAWRDADNWSLDSNGTKIRFRNWTELSAMGLLTAILLILVVFMAL